MSIRSLSRRHSAVGRFSAIRSTLLLTLLASSLVATGCDSGSAIPSETQQNLTLQLSSSLLDMASGDTARLELLQKGGASQVVLRNGVTWTSTDASIASVDANGLVTARTLGETSIHASTALGRSSARVKVKAGKNVSVAPKADTLNAVGDTVRLTAHNPGGNPIANDRVTWTSTAQGVATVNAQGLVTARAAGAAKIVGTAQNGADTVTVLVQLTGYVSVTPSTSTLAVGDSIPMVAHAVNAQGVPITGASFVWTSSNSTLATVSARGVVTSRAEGAVTIIATISGSTAGSTTGSYDGTSDVMLSTTSSSGKSGSAKLTIRQKSQTLQPVTVSPAADTINALGDTASLAATVRDSGGNIVSGATVTWTSLNPDIASVDAAGKVISRAVGVALITAASGGAVDTATVHSRQVVAAVVVSPASGSVAAGSTLQHTAAASDSNGVTINGASFVWNSSNTSVATVSSSGLVKGVASGSATISAASGAKSGTSSVSVTGSSQPIAPSGVLPEQPREFLNTAYQAPGGATIRVRAGESLQNAINNAKRGDILLLEAGATFTGSFTLPAKSGTGWIVIRSDVALPPEGTRVTPAMAANFAKLVGGYEVTLQVESGASHYRIMGLEITTSTSVTSAKRQIHMSPGSSHIIVDRSYVHGHPTLDFTRCILMHATYAAVIDSWVSECHANGFDSQAIAAWNTNGPLKIVNNHLAGAGENVMFGGAMPSEGVIPSDIEIRGNHFYKDPSWKGVWTVKNLFEIKNAQRVLLEGNVFENHWKDAQDGMAFNIKVSDQDGRCTWCTSQDITFRSNIVRNVDGGMKVSNTERILIRNNLFDKLRAFGSNGRLFQIQGGASNVRIENNTGFGTYSIVTTGSVATTGFVMTNNIVTRGAYGIKGDIGGEGTETLENLMPGYVFLGNVLIEATASRYPGQNFFPASLSEVGFVSPSTGDYRLQSTSPYKSKGTDGNDPGANIDVAIARTAGAVPPENPISPPAVGHGPVRR